MKLKMILYIRDLQGKKICHKLDKCHIPILSSGEILELFQQQL